MSDAAEDVNFTLKVMINKQKSKVLFAEADSDFVDVLLSFLTLPLGTIVRTLEKHYGDEAPVIGSLTTLYNGLSNLDSSHFWTESGKQMLLNPRNSSETVCRKLKLNVDDTQPIKYFKCGDRNCKRKRSPNVSMYYDTMKCECGKSLSQEMGMTESKTDSADDGGGVFAINTTSFIIGDDLRMAPNVPGSIIQTLINLGITVTKGAELRNVTVGLYEIMDLLKGSLLYKRPLTYLILRKKRRMKYETGVLLHKLEKKYSSSDHTYKKMTLKLMVQMSNCELLFAQTEEDFIDFLFSLLTIPLGGVERLLGSNTSLRSIDNLYKSITNLIDDKYLRTPKTKNRLIKPELPPKYLSKSNIFSLTEQITPSIYYYFESVVAASPNCTLEKGYWMSLKDPKGDQGSYVRRPGKFMVTDDLSVIPLFMSSTIPIFNALKIPISDVKELEMHIGLKEALSILKASLKSTSALTDGLINPIFEKQPKQEQ